MVYVFGTVRAMLLYPCAMATSSAISHGCKISERVGGTSAERLFVGAELGLQLHAAQQRSHRLAIDGGSYALVDVIYVCIDESRHKIRISALFPRAIHHVHRSTVKGSEQYSLNIVTIVFNTIFALFRSVAVHSMKTSVVSKEIADLAPLMIGGNDKTVPSSPSPRNTALSSMMCKKCFNF